MINGLGRAGPGHACSLMSFLFRQRVNLISFLLQSVIVIELERRHWTELDTGLMALLYNIQSKIMSEVGGYYLPGG